MSVDYFTHDEASAGCWDASHAELPDDLAPEFLGFDPADLPAWRAELMAELNRRRAEKEARDGR